MKFFLIALLFLFSSTIKADVRAFTKEELCMNLAGYYAKGAHKHWLRAITEVRKRKYSFECKEIAELRMAATRYAALPSFKIKLDELFGESPPLNSSNHFLKETEVK